MLHPYPSPDLILNLTLNLTLNLNLNCKPKNLTATVILTLTLNQVLASPHARFFVSSGLYVGACANPNLRAVLARTSSRQHGSRGRA